MVGKLLEFSGFKKILDWLDQLEHLKFPFGVQCASVPCCRLGVLGSWVCWESQARPKPVEGASLEIQVMQPTSI